MKRDVLKEKPTGRDQAGLWPDFSQINILMMKRDGEQGWYSMIEPYGDLQLPPAAPGSSLCPGGFEGMKAHKTDDGRVLMFRPWDNIKRLATSAERICMAPF